MTDVFLAFSAADADRAAPIARALQSRGFNVYQSPGAQDPSAEAQLKAAKAVIIVWTQASVSGDWPAQAADSGKDREILVPVFLDDVSPRVGYGQFQGENLAAYPAAPADAAFERLVTQLEGMRGAAKPSAAPAAPNAAGLLGAAGQQTGMGRFVVPGLLGAALLAGGLQFLNQPKTPPKPTPAVTQPGAYLGAAERYGLSPEDLASLEPEALIATALKNSNIDTIEAGAPEDNLSRTLLCMAQFYGQGTAQDLAAAKGTCARAGADGSTLALYVSSLDARASQDVATADALLDRAAQAGDARAQHDLAAALRVSDPSRARGLAEKCAAQHHLGCRFLLAQMQIAGEGGAKDVAGGKQALDALDTEFYAPAIVALGKMYRDGVGVTAPDLDEAAVRFQRAAVLGDGEANFLLGQMAETGKGLPKDAAKAQEYFAAAKAAGYLAPAK